ncbi:MAG TPA: caspase family protein [Blastocatellia bacterium]|nr:caspase family protein [Blastocatellia bacterium]
MPFAQSDAISKIVAIRVGVIALLLIFSAGLAPGQSTDRDNPTPLDSAELRGELDGTGTEYYFSFVAGPGELTLTIDVKASGTNAGATIDLFDKNSRPIVAGIMVQAIDRGSERHVEKVELGTRQTILMRVKGIDYGSGSGRGTYLIRLGGPAAQGGSAAPPPSASNRNKSEPASRPDKPGDADRPSRVEVISGQKRVALIIGNGSYADMPLRNPVNDARDMAETLRGLGFEVITGENLDKRAMEEHIRAFGKRIAGAGIGLFYFSGHGLQVNGYNYLLPVKARIEKEQDVEYEAVEAGRVLSEMEAAQNRLNIVILDACRNNPFARSFRSATRGLAMMNAPSGTVVAYSTAPGSIASDGDGENGLYTQELLNGMRVPGLKIEDVFKRVRIAVKEKSQGKQIPWETSALDGDFYFVKN